MWNQVQTTSQPATLPPFWRDSTNFTMTPARSSGGVSPKISTWRSSLSRLESEGALDPKIEQGGGPMYKTRLPALRTGDPQPSTISRRPSVSLDWIARLSTDEIDVPPSADFIAPV